VWSVLALVLRGAFWCATPQPRRVGLGVLVGWSMALVGMRLASQYLAAPPPVEFNPYGVNALIAWLVVVLVIAAFFVQPRARTTVLAAMVAFAILIDLARKGIELGLARFPVASPREAILAQLAALGVHVPEQLLEPVLTAAPLALPVIYWIGGMCAILRSFEPGAPLRLIGKVGVLTAVLVGATALIPHAPTFVGPGFDVANANLWEWARARNAAGGAEEPDPDIAAESLRAAQGGLLRGALARIAPQRRGQTDVYALALAGWSDQDVFRKELDGALAALQRVLPIEGHILRLVNNPETVATDPLATRRSFAAAVRALAQVMDRNEDVLLLLVTSHGAEQGVALKLPGGGNPTFLAPQEVKAALDAAGIRNRVVIVSACYSGVFVPPLAGDDSIVLTAADARSASFGCASERDGTYFGDALFKQALRPGTDFKQALDRARILIQGWERLDRIPPSNPQGHFGAALVARLDPLIRAMER
jgi:hypothetical protein